MRLFRPAEFFYFTGLTAVGLLNATRRREGKAEKESGKCGERKRWCVAPLLLGKDVCFLFGTLDSKEAKTRGKQSVKNPKNLETNRQLSIPLGWSPDEQAGLRRSGHRTQYYAEKRRGLEDAVWRHRCFITNGFSVGTGW